MRIPSIRWSRSVRGLVALAALSSTSLTAQAADGPATVAVVLRAATAPETAAGDAAIVQRLETLGYRVRIVGPDQPATAVEGSDAVLISSSVSGYNLGSAYRDVDIPVMTWESSILPYMAMTGKKAGSDYGEQEDERRLWIVNPTHPLGGGANPGHLIAFPKGAEMGWGRPGLGATIIATFPGEDDKAAEFAYEKGAMMDNESVAPARRLFMFLASGSFGSMTPGSRALFDAAVAWTVACNPCPPR